MPRRNDATSLGAAMADRLAAGDRLMTTALASNARDLPVLQDVSLSGETSSPLENKLAEARDILVGAHSVYRQGHNIVMAIGAGETGRLMALTNDADVTPSAPALLANLFVCGSAGKQYPPPKPFVATLLSNHPTRQTLPEIRVYSTTPVFDEDFIMRGPGYHAGPGILVHGPQIEPLLPAAPGLPPAVASYLDEFCFATTADRANVVGILLTRILVNHFVVHGKPIVLVDGNRPDLGKSFLAETMSILLDDDEPSLVKFTADDDEFAKRLCASVRGKKSRTVLIDNTRTKSSVGLNSPTLEALCLAPEISIRILGQSSNYLRANDLIFVVTMNNTRASVDLVSRGLPIRLSHDGDPLLRPFRVPDLKMSIRRRRLEILAELYGMVERWSQTGRCLGPARHRCRHWSQVIGGILAANGVRGFLDNLAEAQSAFNADTDELASLTEWTIQNRPSAVLELVTGQTDTVLPEGVAARELVAGFQGQRVAVDQLERTRSDRGRTTIVGTYLAAQLERPFGVEIQGRNATVSWHRRPARANQVRYYVRVEWHVDTDDGSAAGAAGEAERGGHSAPPVTLPMRAYVRGGEDPTTGNNEQWGDATHG